MPQELRNLPTFREVRPRKPKPGALNMGEEGSDMPEEDPEFEEDDITSLAHGQLEQHREYRHYARLAAWEMPLLTSKFSIITTLIHC
jgi:small subunit ribosomal protein S35